jgi:hypothetical protein
MLKEITEMHPNAPFIRRNGEVNAWDNPDFRKAVEATGRKQIILGGIVTEVCEFCGCFLTWNMQLMRRQARCSLPCP